MAGRFEWFTKNRSKGNGDSASDDSIADEWHIDLTYVPPITSGVNPPEVLNFNDPDASGGAGIAVFDEDTSSHPTHQIFFPKEIFGYGSHLLEHG